MLLRTIAALAAAGLVASAAPAKERAPTAAAHQCFQLSAVSGYTHARSDRLYVHTGPGETYLFRTMGPCPDLGWSEAIALDPATAGPICTGIDVDLIVPSRIGPQRCPVSMIRKLAPGEKEQR
jgi:hypothetical protein